MRFFINIYIVFLIWLHINLTTANHKPTPNFRTSKNVAFASSGGGSSHHIWVFEILKDMHKRGHNISFFSREDQLRFAEGYPISKVRIVGGVSDLLHHPTLIRQHMPLHPHAEISGAGISISALLNYSMEFEEYKQLFQAGNIDLVVCDFFAISCVDAAIVSKLPAVITTTIPLFSDGSAKYINSNAYNIFEPTTENESFWFRAYRDYIRLPRLRKYIETQAPQALSTQRDNGLTPSIDIGHTKYNHITKLVNNVYGIELARKVSPLSHMIGPIMRGSYPMLDNDTANFLDARQKVAYIAFGQHFNPNKNDAKMFIQTLFILMEQGIIDGIIWARIDQSYLPSTIKTPKRLYSYEEIVNHKDLYLIKWAPQFAILKHSSTSFFISHGGAGSLHEALYNGVRLFVFPFFGDQPVNARAIERTGIGSYMDSSKLKYDAKDYKNFYEKLNKIAVDPENKVQKTVNRYKAYVQLGAENAITRGADLMEESLFASDENGHLMYRRDVGESIHWIKRNNIDVYTFLAVIILCILQVCLKVLNEIMKYYTKYQKVKTF